MENHRLHNEKELLRRVADGDDTAFEILFRAYHQLLGDYIYRLTGTKETAQDITQEAFIKAWQHRKTLAEINHFKSWLFTVSRNKAFDTLRDQSRLLLRQKEWARQQESLLAGMAEYLTTMRPVQARIRPLYGSMRHWQENRLAAGS